VEHSNCKLREMGERPFQGQSFQGVYPEADPGMFAVREIPIYDDPSEVQRSMSCAASAVLDCKSSLRIHAEYFPGRQVVLDDCQGFFGRSDAAVAAGFNRLVFFERE
jgi:hypothetical protein